MNDDRAERNRRSVYVFVRRNNRYPLLDCFDAPDTLESCPARNMTTTPLQALTMIEQPPRRSNWAQAFAGRVLRDEADRRPRRVGRLRVPPGVRPPPTPASEAVRQFFDRHRDDPRPTAAGRRKLTARAGERGDPVDGAVLVDLCHTLLNSNEFVYRELTATAP